MMTLPASLSPLAAADFWVGWRWARRANGKLTKPPVNAIRGGPAESDNPKTWASFAAAVEAVEAGRAAGVGYVCLYDRERIFVDLDKCRDGTTGAVADWAMRIVEAAGSYTEVTPSGTGLRIIGNRGHLTAPISRALKLGAEGHEVEVYYQATRYVTVTGDRLPGTPDQLADIADVALDLLVAGGKAAAAEEGGAQPFEPNAEQVAPLEDVEAALAAIGNPDLPYEEWVKIGMAAFAATGGSAFGRLAWVAWSRKSAKHDDDECTRVWRSFRAAPPTKIGFGTLYHLASAADAFWQPPSWAARRAEHVERENGKAGPGENTAENPDPWAETAKPEPKLLPLVYFREFEPNLDVADFVEGILTAAAMSVVYGESNAGKTFVVTDLAAHVATGQAWRGREVEAGGVIYCALEGRHGIGNRIAAFKRQHGLEGAEVPFAVIPVALNLLDPAADREPLIRTILAAAAAMGIRVALIVIDTLSRALAGGNENDSQDMGALVATADAIRQATGAHILFVHHSGKDAARGARGHSLLRAATDTEIEISRPDDAPVGTIRVTKQRDMARAPEMHFRLEVVELGRDRRDKPVTSCVVGAVGPEEAPPPKAKRTALPPAAQVALSALQWAIGEAGIERRGLRNVPGNTKTVTEDEWRRAFYNRSTAPTQPAKAQAFRRAGEVLDARGLAMKMDNLAWIVRDQT